MKNHSSSPLVVALILATINIASTFGAQAQSTEQVLYTFTGNLDGAYPTALISDAAGNLYGAAAAGGTNLTGTVFELSPISGGGWTESILYNFGPFRGGSDGDQPVGALLLDSSGNLYGTTGYGGGSTNCGFGCGTVFRLSPGSGGWTESILHSFVGTDGQNPVAQLALDAAGNLYGTTRIGGPHGNGTVFELSLVSGKWKMSLPHSFAGGTDGEDPFHAGVVIDASGNLYGTTFYGGASLAGQVFELSLTAGKWKKTTLHSFVRGIGIGGYLEGGVTLDSAGNLFGTTTQAGAAGTGGGVFELKLASGGKRTYSILHSFGAAGDGDFPSTAVVLDGAGNLYGTTNEGGSSGDGTVYELTPRAKGAWKETILWSFLGGTDGMIPNTTPLLLDQFGNAFGSTNAGGDGFGVIFEVSP